MTDLKIKGKTVLRRTSLLSSPKFLVSLILIIYGILISNGTKPLAEGFSRNREWKNEKLSSTATVKIALALCKSGSVKQCCCSTSKTVSQVYDKSLQVHGKDSLKFE